MTLGISWVDPQQIKALREAQQEKDKADAKTKAAQRQPLPRRRMTCPSCAGRRIELTPEHTVKKCQVCGAVGTVEALL